MSSSSSNNVGDDAWLLQMEFRREEEGEDSMEEGDGDSLEVHPPASERGTLASISTILNPHQAFSLLICKIYTRREIAGNWNSGPEKAMSEIPILHISK